MKPPITFVQNPPCPTLSPRHFLCAIAVGNLIGLSGFGLIDCLALGEWEGFILNFKVRRAGFILKFEVRRAGFVRQLSVMS